MLFHVGTQLGVAIQAQQVTRLSPILESDVALAHLSVQGRGDWTASRDREPVKRTLQRVLCREAAESRHTLHQPCQAQASSGKASVSVLSSPTCQALQAGVRWHIPAGSACTGGAMLGTNGFS